MEEYPAEWTSPKQPNNLLSNNFYDLLKWVAQIGLPALGSLYFGLAEIWGLPNASEVVGTIVVLDAFLGVVLGISSAKYKDPREGELVGFADVSEDDEGRKQVMLNFPGDPMDVVKQDRITFQVRHIS